MTMPSLGKQLLVDIHDGDTPNIKGGTLQFTQGTGAAAFAKSNAAQRLTNPSGEHRCRLNHQLSRAHCSIAAHLLNCVMELRGTTLPEDGKDLLMLTSGGDGVGGRAVYTVDQPRRQQL
jgi:hypothetical protein